MLIKSSHVLNNLSSLKIESAPNCKVESIFIKITKNSVKLILGGIYRHSNGNLEAFTGNFEKINIKHFFNCYSAPFRGLEHEPDRI